MPTEVQYQVDHARAKEASDTQKSLAGIRSSLKHLYTSCVKDRQIDTIQKHPTVQELRIRRRLLDTPGGSIGFDTAK